MVTGKENLLQAIMEAYLMEKGTCEFYRSAAGKAKNTEASGTFKELSQWEEKHMEYIQFLYQSIVEDYDMVGFEEFKKRAESPATESGIPVKDLEAKIEKYDFIDDKGALDIALQIEGKAYNLYHKLADTAEDTDAQIIFKEMMFQEAKHIDYLKKLKSILD